jgi:hypothetical protein
MIDDLSDDERIKNIKIPGSTSHGAGDFIILGKF